MNHLFNIHLPHVRITHQIFTEKESHSPKEIFRHAAIDMIADTSNHPVWENMQARELHIHITYHINHLPLNAGLLLN